MSTSSNPSSSILVARELSKSFTATLPREGIRGLLTDLVSPRQRTVHAVCGVSFAVRKGEILGFIGPNGAGKSTTIKMLTGILKPTSGEMSVLGFHPFHERRIYTNSIGVVFGQRTQLWWDIAVIESFRLLARLYGVEKSVYQERLAVLTEVLDLKEILNTPVRRLSLGQRIRADLAAGLLHQPPILFLDEPTVGLDAVGKQSVRKFLRFLNEQFQTTILLTTHDLQEIEELCDRVVIIDHGTLLFDGEISTVRELAGLSRMLEVEMRVPLFEEVRQKLGEISSEIQVEPSSEDPRKIIIHYNPSRHQSGSLIRTIIDCGEIDEIATRDPSIEEVIINVYKEGKVSPSKEAREG